MSAQRKRVLGEMAESCECRHAHQPLSCGFLICRTNSQVWVVMGRKPGSRLGLGTGLTFFQLSIHAHQMGLVIPARRGKFLGYPPPHNGVRASLLLHF